MRALSSGRGGDRGAGCQVPSSIRNGPVPRASGSCPRWARYRLAQHAHAPVRSRPAAVQRTRGCAADRVAPPRCRFCSSLRLQPPPLTLSPHYRTGATQSVLGLSTRHPGWSACLRLLTGSLLPDRVAQLDVPSTVDLAGREEARTSPCDFPSTAWALRAVGCLHSVARGGLRHFRATLAASLRFV